MLAAWSVPSIDLHVQSAIVHHRSCAFVIADAASVYSRNLRSQRGTMDQAMRELTVNAQVMPA